MDTAEPCILANYCLSHSTSNVGTVELPRGWVFFGRGIIDNAINLIVNAVPLKFSKSMLRTHNSSLNLEELLRFYPDAQVGYVFPEYEFLSRNGVVAQRL